MKPHKHAEVIKAWADGAEIECKNAKGKNYPWLPAGSNPHWYPDFEYRIKPKHKIILRMHIDLIDGEKYSTIVNYLNFPLLSDEVLNLQVDSKGVITTGRVDKK